MVFGQELLGILLHDFPRVGVVLQLLNEVLRLLAVDAREGADVLDKTLEQFRLEGVGLLRNEGSLFEDHSLGEFWTGREQSPVDIASVPEVWVFALLGDVFEKVLQNLLPFCRFVQIELHAADQDLVLHHVWLVLEVLCEVVQ